MRTLGKLGGLSAAAASLALGASIALLVSSPAAAQPYDMYIAAPLVVDLNGLLSSVPGTPSQPANGVVTDEDEAPDVYVTVYDSGRGLYYDTGSGAFDSPTPVENEAEVVHAFPIGYTWSIQVNNEYVISPSQIVVTAYAEDSFGVSNTANSYTSISTLAEYLIPPPNVAPQTPACPSGTNAVSGSQSTNSPQGGAGPSTPAMWVTPHFNNLAPLDSRWGYGWTTQIDPFLTQNPNGSFSWNDGQGGLSTIALGTPTASGLPTYVPPATIPVTITATAVDASSQPLTVVIRQPNGTSVTYERQVSTGALNFLPTLLVDKNSNPVNYSRTASGQPTLLTDVHGRTVSIAYNNYGRVSSVTSNAGQVNSYYYNSLGDKVSDTDPDGDATLYGYSSHLISTTTYPNSGTRVYDYDFSNRVIFQSDDGGNNADVFTYYPASSAVIDALSRQTTYHYTTFESLQLVTGIQDALGDNTSFTYDINLYLSQQTDALGHSTYFQYDDTGNVTNVTDALGNQTLMTYDPTFSGTTLIIDPLLNSTTMTYDATGDLIQTTDALDEDTVMTYDSMGHVATVTDPLLHETSFYYNGNGGLSATTDPLDRTTNMARDAANRLTALTDPMNNTTQFQYDPANNLTQVTDAYSHQTNYGYIPGRPTRLLQTVTDANSHTTTFGYDIIGRLSTSTDADNQTKSFSYDLVGNLTQTVDPDSHTIHFSYDPLNRLANKTLPEGNIHYGYDAVSNSTGITHYDGAVDTMTYDADNRVTQVVQTLPDGYQVTIGYAYDADGNRVAMTTPWGNFHYGYDPVNRSTGIVNPYNETIAIGYDAAGRRSSLTYPNGVTATYTYDNANELLGINYMRNSDSVILASAAYSYDNAGNRLTMTDWAGTHVYSYDNLYRSTGAFHPAASLLPTLNETFSYDPVGNRLADSNITGYSYDAANRLLSNSSFTYTYDNNGNQTNKWAVGAATTTYVYDSQNELTAVELPSGTTAWFQYDGLGRRVQKSTASVTSSTSTVYYVYDNQNILAMLDGNNNLLALFTNGPNLDEPLIMHRGDGTEYTLHADGLGSIIAEVNMSTNVVERISYEAYGQPLYINLTGSGPATSTASLTGNPFAFTGLIYDSDTGLYYNRARQTYDPIIGRFGQEDPLEMNLANNRFTMYSYALNNPVNKQDPTGLSYSDINISPIPFIISGVMVNQNGSYFYIGLGLSLPGASYTTSSSNPSLGWNYQAQVTAPGALIGPTIASGFDFTNLQQFTESGAGTPGGSVGIFYTFSPVNPSNLLLNLLGLNKNATPINSVKQPNVCTQ